MKLQTVLTAALFGTVSSLSFGAYAADTEKAPATEGQVKKIKPHSHLEEKTGMSQKAPEAAADEKLRADKDKSRHYHPRDAKYASFAAFAGSPGVLIHMVWPIKPASEDKPRCRLRVEDGEIDQCQHAHRHHNLENSCIWARNYGVWPKMRRDAGLSRTGRQHRFLAGISMAPHSTPARIPMLSNA